MIYEITTQMDFIMHTDLTDLKNHIILTASSKIIEICNPLFQSFNTTYFNFVRRYEDGSETCLTTDPKWTEYFYTNKLYKFVLSDKFAQTKSIVNKLKIIPWSQFSNSPVRIAQSKHFGIGIGISLIFTRNGHADFFHFGTNNQNTEMTELYINYADCLVQFAYYFYDKANQIIALASHPKNRLIIKDRPDFRKDNDFPDIKNFNINHFINESQPKKFMVYSNKLGEILLTKKEIMCIHLLTQGKTANEIGCKLYMSKRTVETHLKNAKTKLGLGIGANKSDLISELYKDGFDLSTFLPI